MPFSRSCRTTKNCRSQLATAGGVRSTDRRADGDSPAAEFLTSFGLTQERCLGSVSHEFGVDSLSLLFYSCAYSTLEAGGVNRLN